MHLVKTPLTPERAAALLVDTVRQLADATTLGDITGLVKRTARELLGADGATFVLREGDQCHYVDEDAIAPLWMGKKFPMPTCVSGWAMQYRQQAIIPDITVDPRIPQDAYRPTFVKSLVMTPVRILQPWAAIGTYWATPFTPSAEEAGWLQMLADSTAIALENVRRQAEIEELKLDAAHQPMVKMCAWTRRVEFHGEWMSVEAYLLRRFDLKVTHSISPEGLAMMTPEFAALGEVA
jgi:GAF domain-containing protein